MGATQSAVIQDASDDEVEYSDADTDISHSTPIKNDNVTRNSETDELNELRIAFEQCRQENFFLRKSLGLSSEDPVDRTRVLPIPSATSPSYSSNTLIAQYEERERVLLNENNFLKREIDTLDFQLKETFDKLEKLNNEHQNEIARSEDEKAKADRTLRRLKSDYDTRIANMKQGGVQSSANHETYRHEPLLARIRFTYPLQGQATSNVDIQAYLDKIADQEHIIKQLTKGKAPMPITYPPNTDSELTYENIQRLKDKIKRYSEDFNKLQSECEQLRQSEKKLRHEIDEIQRYCIPFEKLKDRVRVSVPSTSSPFTSANQQTDSPQSLVTGTTSNLREDATHVSNIKDYVAQLVQETADYQRIVKNQDAEIQEYKLRSNSKSDIRIRELEYDIESLKKEVENRVQSLKVCTDENERLRATQSHRLEEMKLQYTEEIQTLHEEHEELTQQIRQSNERYDQSKADVVETQRQYEELRIKYENTKAQLQSMNTDDLTHQIRVREKQIEDYHRKFDQMTIDYEEELNQRQRQIDVIEKENAKRVLDTEIRRFDELQTNYDRLQSNGADHKDRLEKQRQTYELQISELEKAHDNKYEQLKQTTDALRKEIVDCRVRVQHYEDENERFRTEYQTSDHNYQHIKHERDVALNNLNEVKRKCAQLEHDLIAAETRLKENERKSLILNDENTKFKHELDELKIKITIQIQEQYENEYHNRYEELTARKDAEISNALEEVKTAESNYQRCNNERVHFEKQFHAVENELQKANRTLENHVKDISRLKEDLQRSNEQSDHDYHTFNEQLNSANHHIQQLEQRIQEKNQRILELTGNPKDVTPSLKPNDRLSLLTTYEQKIAELRKNVQEQEELIKLLQTEHPVGINDLDDIYLEIRIRIDQLEQDLQAQDNTIDPKHSDRNTLIHDKPSSYEKRSSWIIVKHDFEKCKQELVTTADKLTRAEQIINDQQHEIEHYKQEHHNLTIKLNILLDEKDVLTDRIRALEKEWKLRPIPENPSESDDQYENEIRTFQNTLQQREDSIQTLQDLIHTLKQDLNNVHQAKDKIQADYNQMTKQVTSLHEESSIKDREIRKLDDLIKNIRSTGDSSSTIVLLQNQIQQRDQEINNLIERLESNIPNQPSPTHSTTVIYEHASRRRPDIDRLTHEELLFELDTALEINRNLHKQLNEKAPPLTEIHKQLVEVRKELERQKYVNQVLWRKLDALIDIHGSNTRAELAIELANYQEEVANLKAQRTQQNLSTLNQDVSSMGIELPSKNIKSTIALLERSSIEWQTKLARLTEQLGRSESQSRNYQRELTKCQKQLYQAGLAESSMRQRRHSADDSVILGLNESNKKNDDLTKIENIDELKEIVRNQRKYLQQLQTHVRINTPDLLQLPTLEKFNEQIQ
ncbi:unnamed protein product, partial [Adineta steineri]